MVILLTILKIAGIILLSLLGLLVFLILMAAFYPVGYRINGSIDERITVYIRARWLLSIIRFCYCYTEGEQQAWLRIFGIRIMLLPAREKESRKHRKKKRKKEDKTQNIQNTQNTTKEVIPDILQDSVQQIEQLEPIKHVEQASTLAIDEPAKRKKKRAGLHLWMRVKDIPNRFKNRMQSIKNFKYKVGSLKTEILDEGNRSALKFLLSELFKLLQRYHPRKIKADISFATTDPALTGQILAGLSIFPFLYQKHVSIQPDFESEKFYIKGSFDIKGHIQVIHLLSAAWRIYKNKDVRALIRKAR